MPNWPRYTPTSVDGPGCGTAAHSDECLCDVVIPARLPVEPLQRMVYASTAYLALEARGNEDPSTLDVAEQILALRDAVDAANVSPSLHQASLLVAEAYELWFSAGAFSNGSQSAHNGVMVPLRAALRLVPLPVVAGMLGVSPDMAMSLAFRMPESRVRAFTNATLAGDNITAVCDRFFLPHEKTKEMWHAMRHHRPEKTSGIERAAEMFISGQTRDEVMAATGLSATTVRKAMAGVWGPLKPLRARVKDELAMGRHKDEILGGLEPRVRHLAERMIENLRKRHMSTAVAA